MIKYILTNEAILVLLFITLSGCAESYLVTAEMKARCDQFRYQPATLSEISASYPDSTDHEADYFLVIKPDSTYIESLHSSLGPPSVVSGRCSLVKDSLQLIPVKYGEGRALQVITETQREQYFNTYPRRHLYLIRKVNEVIYLLHPYQTDKFCHAVAENLDKSEFFHTRISK